MDEAQGINQALPSLFQGTQTKSRQPSAATLKLISELGLRFPPASRVDQEGRAGQLGLLARDVMDIPSGVLDRAIQQWVKNNRFLPTAAELIRMSHDIQAMDQIRNSPRQGYAETKKKDGGPFSAAELQRLVDASPETVQYAILQAGLTGEFIEHDGKGNYREKGGSVIVRRRGAIAHNEPATE